MTSTTRQRSRADVERSRARRRRRLTAAHAANAAVLVVLLAVVLTGGRAPAPGTVEAAAPADVAATVAGITSVPDDVLEKAAAAVAAPRGVSSRELTAGGKPQVLYVGAEFCPYCAALRWPIVVALSRFGTFSGLGVTRSSTSDVYPGTASLSFHGATYTSDYLAWDAKELYSNAPSGQGYAPLDTLTPDEQSVFADKSLNPQSGFPFLDLGGRFVAGTPFDPAVLKGLSATQIATAAHDGTGAAGAAIDSSANVLTAALCGLTGDQPRAVCTAPAVVAAKGRLG